MVNLDPAKYAVAWIAPLEIEARAALHMRGLVTDLREVGVETASQALTKEE